MAKFPITSGLFKVLNAEAKALVPVDSDIDQLAVALEELETKVGRLADRTNRRVSPTIYAMIEEARSNLFVVSDVVIKAADFADADKFGDA
jgi:hypothetical protein